jgi:hypothetical protein
MPSKKRPIEKVTASTERSLWQLGRDEQRVLIITFVGGLASIVAAAVVVGGAIALAHYEQEGNSLSALAGGTGLAVLLVALSAAVVLLTFRPDGVNRSEKLIVTVLGGMYLIVLIPLALELCLLVLTWIGIAAGIH